MKNTITEIIEPQLQFQSLSEDAVQVALADPNNSVAVEVARLITAYTKTFVRHVKQIGYLPPHILHVKARWPIEAVAMRLAPIGSMSV